MTILVTGAAGFIGYHVARRLLERGERVVGIDNLNPYYDPRLKQDRLDELRRLGTGELRLPPGGFRRSRRARAERSTRSSSTGSSIWALRPAFVTRSRIRAPM